MLILDLLKNFYVPHPQIHILYDLHYQLLCFFSTKIYICLAFSFNNLTHIMWFEIINYEYNTKM